MKSYPSIPRATGQAFRAFDAYVFDKLDGSNLRFEWSKKQGWHKFGTRNRLFDETDEVFGCAVSLFQNDLGFSIAKVAIKERWESVIVFAEFYGDNSFAGVHDPADEKRLALFDVAPYKKGILGPKEFVKLFGHLEITKFLGLQHWSREFVEAVRLNQIEGVTFEGVVGKTGEGHNLVMAKAKTQDWIDKVKARYSEEDARKIIES